MQCYDFGVHKKLFKKRLVRALAILCILGEGLGEFLTVMQTWDAVEGLQLSRILPAPLVFILYIRLCKHRKRFLLLNALSNGLPQDRGQPTGIRLSEVHVGRECDILNVPRVGNLTQLPSWKVEDQGMSGKRSAVLENTQ